ncbi:MAG TPA: glycosyltransferase family 2 protein [Chitinophagaceae bacterium]|nr:glycosyltransferase family 2 protein [Chitinophagaceae bacterium]
MPQISIIVPVYNEAENILPLFYEIKKYCPEDFEVIWVDDGSTDDTLAEIQQLSSHEERIKCVSLSRNFGHQNATLAGLNYASGKYIITMDGDLQHPPTLIPEMIRNMKQGFDIVFTKKKCTEKVNYLRKAGGWLFYQIINFFSATKCDENVTEYRAFKQKVLEGVLQFTFKEKGISLKSVFNWIGYKSVTIEYTCIERQYGKTKYSFWKKIVSEAEKIILFNPKLSKFIIIFITLLLAIMLINHPLWHLLSNDQNQGTNSMHITLSVIIVIMQFFLIIMIVKLTNISHSNSRNRPLYLVKEIINF